MQDGPRPVVRVLSHFYGGKNTSDYAPSECVQALAYLLSCWNRIISAASVDSAFRSDGRIASLWRCRRYAGTDHIALNRKALFLWEDTHAFELSVTGLGDGRKCASPSSCRVHQPRVFMRRRRRSLSRTSTALCGGGAGTACARRLTISAT